MRSAPARERRAVLMLLIACVIWGMGFNWNKQGQAILGLRLAEQTGSAASADLGPAWFLATRFSLATALWAILVPASRVGWTGTTLRGGGLGGLFLATGMLLQHYGLAHTSESLSAFLTSLTVLFTPFIAVFALRHRVGRWMWLSVAFATGGVAMMTLGRDQGGVDRGAVLGLLCALVFSAHILVVDHFGRAENPWRFSLAQLLFGTLVFIGFAVVYGAVEGSPGITQIARAACGKAYLGWLMLTALPGTIITFGIMFRYQPDTSATRAALTYLSEPIIATTYAWIVSGTAITRMAMLGAGLILLGNVLAEFLGRPPQPADEQANEPVGPLLD